LGQSDIKNKERKKHSKNNELCLENNISDSGTSDLNISIGISKSPMSEKLALENIPSDQYK